MPASTTAADDDRFAVVLFAPPAVQQAVKQSRREGYPRGDERRSARPERSQARQS